MSCFQINLRRVYMGLVFCLIWRTVLEGRTRAGTKASSIIQFPFLTPLHLAINLTKMPCFHSYCIGWHIFTAEYCKTRPFRIQQNFTIFTKIGRFVNVTILVRACRYLYLHRPYRHPFSSIGISAINKHMKSSHMKYSYVFCGDFNNILFFRLALWIDCNFSFHDCWYSWGGNPHKLGPIFYKGLMFSHQTDFNF